MTDSQRPETTTDIQQSLARPYSALCLLALEYATNSSADEEQEEVVVAALSMMCRSWLCKSKPSAVRCRPGLSCCHCPNSNRSAGIRSPLRLPLMSHLVQQPDFLTWADVADDYDDCSGNDSNTGLYDSLDEATAATRTNLRLDRICLIRPEHTSISMAPHCDALLRSDLSGSVSTTKQVILHVFFFIRFRSLTESNSHMFHQEYPEIALRSSKTLI